MCGEWIVVGAKLETGRQVRRLFMRLVRRSRQETMIAWAKIIMMEKDKWTDLGCILPKQHYQST